MFDLNVLLHLMAVLAGWVATTDGSNALFGAICVVALLGVNARICVCLTLALHLILMLI